MKNKLLLSIVLLLLLVSVFLNVYLYTSLNTKIDNKEEEIKQLEKKYVDSNTKLEESEKTIQRLEKNKEETLIETPPHELTRMLNNKETFILVISQAGCSHCQEYVPVLSEALRETKRQAYIVEVDRLDTPQKEEVKKHFSYNGTPTTFYVKNGTIDQSLTKVGTESKESIITRINKLFS